MLRRALLTAFLAATVYHPALAATRALVIGVDAYPHEVSLEGAVKDARDVSTALQGAGVGEILTFYDAQARKDDIRAAWTGLVAASAAGDTIILTYAGHGSQNLTRATENSCNCCFMKLALTMGTEKFYDYLYAYQR